MSTPTLSDILSKKLEQKRKDHPSFRLMEIDNRLFPNAQTMHSTLMLEARDYSNKLKTVKEIVAESWEKESKNHLMIEGEGGIGKTVTLLSIPDKFTPFSVPAIYIPLHELTKKDDPIEYYIKRWILNNKEDLFGQLLDQIGNPWDKGPRLLLLLDGFNEIDAENRKSISEDIEHWSEYPGIQIITSSRFDIHKYVYLRSNYSKIELQLLSKETVIEYLRSTHMPIPKDMAIVKLITLPLLLTLYVITEKIRESRPSPFASFRETTNAGNLIWNYLQCELSNFRNDHENSKTCILALEFIAPYLAWTMQQFSDFVLSEEVFRDKMGEAYDFLKSHFLNHKKLPKHIKNTLQQTNKQLPDSSSICILLQEQLGLFIRQERLDSQNEVVVEYRLMHQQFRDALAAMHLINLSYLYDDRLPPEWESPIDYYVIRFVADLISKEEETRLWEQNRKTAPAIENAMKNQLRLQGLHRSNDFSELDFSGLDLSNISLYPYRFNKITIKLPPSERMTKTKFSNKTFSPEGHEGCVLSVTIAPNGKHIVSGSKDGSIRIWDLETGDPIGDPIGGHRGPVHTVAITRDGKRIVSGSEDGTIRVWNLETSKPIGKPIEGHEGPVLAIAVTRDGKRIVSGSVDKTIRIWDLESHELIGEPIIGHNNLVMSISLTRDGKHIISGSYDKTIRVWNLETGKPIGKPIDGHEGPVLSVAVTRDGKRIVSGSVDKTIRVWDMGTGKPTRKPIEGHNGPVLSVAVTRDGKRIFSGSVDRTIRVWDIETGKPIGEPFEGHEGLLSAIALTRDEKRIISGSYDKTIRVWDIENGKQMGRPIEGHSLWVNVIAITPDGKYIISGSDDDTIRVWDLKTCKPIGAPIEGNKSHFNAVALTHDRKYIVVGYVDNTIRVWNLRTGEPQGKPLEGHEGSVLSVTVTQDGRRIVSGADDNAIRVWDMETGKPIGEPFIGHKSGISAVAVTPDGNYVVSGSKDKTICIWDIETGEPINEPFEGHEGGVNTVAITAITPDEFRIVSSSNDQTIRVWDFWFGGPIEEFKEGHVGLVYAIAAAPRTIRIVGATGNIINVWDLKTREPIGTSFHELELDTFDINQDGFRIISGFENKSFRNREVAHHVKTIHIHPLSFVGLDFSKAIISSSELKETLRQNGAKVDPD